MIRKRKRKSEVFLLLYKINSLSHSGIKGMRWGRRRYQNKDGSLTPMGRQHYGVNGYRGFADYNPSAGFVKKKLKREMTMDRYIKKKYDENALTEDILERRYNQGQFPYPPGSKGFNDTVMFLRGKDNAKRMMVERMRSSTNRYEPREETVIDMKPFSNKFMQRIPSKNAGIKALGSIYDNSYSGYDDRIEKAYNQSFAKAQRKWEKQQARRQFASSIASIAGQRLADYAVDAAVGAVSKQLNKAILDNKPSKGGYDYRQDVINTKKSLKSHLKDTASSGKRVMTEAKLAPSYKNLYNRLKASGRVNSFNQFLNEVYYPDLERRR